MQTPPPSFDTVCTNAILASGHRVIQEEEQSRATAGVFKLSFLHTPLYNNLKPVSMLLTKSKCQNSTGFLKVLQEWMKGLWLKGMLCSYPLSCVHIQRKLQPN